MLYYSILYYGFIGVVLISTILAKNTFFSFLMMGGIFILLYARFIEPYFLSLNNITVKAPKLNTSLKIVFISDLQVGKHKKKDWVRKLVNEVEKINPDLVLLGGDYIFNEDDTKGEVKNLEPLGDLSKFKSFAVLGNHEYGLDYVLKSKQSAQVYPNHAEEVFSKLTSLGIKVLRNTSEKVQIKNEMVTIYGTDDFWAKKDKWLIDNINHTFIALAHNPDSLLTYPENLKKPDLVLCGHTHAGQVRLPFFGPLGNAKTNLGKKYYQGLTKFKDISVFISRGVGESGYPIRFFAPPEIAIITLEP